MWITSTLSEDLCFARVPVASKKRVIDSLAQLFAEHFEEVDAAALFMNLINREKLGSTGIGEGIAIPHCRFPTLGRTFCACMTLEDAVDFDSVDQRPVDLVFAMVVPEGEESDHLERLAHLASKLQDRQYVERLRAARSAQELYLAATAV